MRTIAAKDAHSALMTRCSSDVTSYMLPWCFLSSGEITYRRSQKDEILDFSITVMSHGAGNKGFDVKQTNTHTLPLSSFVYITVYFTVYFMFFFYKEGTLKNEYFPHHSTSLGRAL